MTLTVLDEFGEIDNAVVIEVGPAVEGLGQGDIEGIRGGLGRAARTQGGDIGRHGRIAFGMGGGEATGIASFEE